MKKNIFYRAFSMFVVSLMLSVTAVGCAACDKKPSRRFAAEAILHAEGDLIVDYNGNPVMLRGINAGGYLVIEPWMCAIEGVDHEGESIDHKGLTETFVQRFGKEKTLSLWEYYRSMYWSDEDFQNCADMGFNVIRLPFTYMSVDPEYNNVKDSGEKYNFEILDDFVDRAERHGLYTILDLHGAYGSQNGQHHSGEILQHGTVDFYHNGENMQKTVDLWSALAEHFKDNVAVAGYDILNEPAETQADGSQKTTDLHWNYFDRLYRAIREKDREHIIMIESCWEPNDLPDPKKYGWENCVYSLHHYSGQSDPTRHIPTVRAKKENADRTKYDVPFYMGEFSCYNNSENWRQTLALFEEWEWSWTSWTYKLNERNRDRIRYPGWGVYVTYAERVNAVEDSEQVIREKWAALATSQSEEFKFSDGITLFDLYKEHIDKQYEN